MWNSIQLLDLWWKLSTIFVLVKFIPSGLVQTDSPPKKISTRAKNRDIDAEARPIDVGSSLRAAISHCDGPDCFYMQGLDAVEEIQRFQDDMQTYYKKVG